MSDRMTGLGHHTVEVCNKILKRIWAELETTDEQTAISNLMAWLNCCQIETELLEAEEQLDEISQQYLLTYRNKLNGRNYLVRWQAKFAVLLTPSANHMLAAGIFYRGSAS